MDSTYRLPIPGSSNWIERPHFVKLFDYIKRFVYFALHSPAPSQQSPGTKMNKEERIDSLYRTLIGNQIVDGGLPPAEWSSMFNILINSPSFAPDDFVSGPPTDRPHIPTDGNSVPGITRVAPAPEGESTTVQLTENQQAQAYVQPLIETIWHSLDRRKVFITKEGHLGLASEEAEKGDLISVFLGCGFPVALRNGRSNRWDWKGRRNISRMEGMRSSGR